MPPISDARKRANVKYNAKAYEQIQLRVKTGKKALIQAHADIQGESINGFINRAIDAQIKNDNEKAGE